MAPDENLPRSSRPVFRAEAVRHYVRSRDQVILPRYVSRRAVALLWGSLALAAALIAVLLGARLPLYTSGTAVAQAGHAAAGEPGLVAVSVPAQAAARIRSGQAAYFRGRDGDRRLAGRVAGAGGGTAPSGTEAVVLVRLAPGAERAARACRPPACRVDIRIGAPRALAFFAPGGHGTGN